MVEVRGDVAALQGFPVVVQKLFDRLAPVWKAQIRQVLVYGLENVRVGVKIGNALVGGPIVQAL